MTDPSDILLRHLFWSFLLQPQLSQTDKKQKVKITVAPATTLLIHRKNKKEKKRQAKITGDGKTESHKTAWHFHSACLDWGLLCPCAFRQIYSTEPMLAAPLCAQVVFFFPLLLPLFFVFILFLSGESCLLIWFGFSFSFLYPPFWGGVSICSPG